MTRKMVMFFIILFKTDIENNYEKTTLEYVIL